MSSGFLNAAKVVIVGGGVMGVGLAYHLAHEGWTDVVLLEKAELTSGSTWPAADQITHSTSSFGLGKCVDYNIGLYSGVLEAQTGQATIWHGCGSLCLTYTEDELDWLWHTLSVGTSLGFNIGPVGRDRIREFHPFYNPVYNPDGVLGALHTPDDGQHTDLPGRYCLDYFAPFETVTLNQSNLKFAQASARQGKKIGSKAEFTGRR